jgi:hypothetical protein
MKNRLCQELIILISLYFLIAGLWFSWILYPISQPTLIFERLINVKQSGFINVNLLL